MPRRSRHRVATFRPGRRLLRRCRLGALGARRIPTPRLVLEDHPLQQLAHGLLLGFRKLADCFELQRQVVAGAALLFAEHQIIRLTGSVPTIGHVLCFNDGGIEPGE
jgi:hypothetical protein